jgi:uncharacterized protein YdeI (YjbR/CyaY-like superfamily)
MEIPEINAYTVADFRKWLKKNHTKETKVRVIIHKKHTGKGFPTHRELLDEAICYGWIDTTIKRLDEDTFVRNFSRRNGSSKWSDNTLKYAKQLIKDGRMQPEGLARYEEGKKRPTHDAGIPKNPDMPKELKQALAKNPDARKNFEKVAPSMKRALYRFILRGVQAATREKRIKKIIDNYGRSTKSVFWTNKDT